MASAMELAEKTRVAMKLTRKLRTPPTAETPRTATPAPRVRRPLPLEVARARVPLAARPVVVAVPPGARWPARAPAPRRRPLPEGACVRAAVAPPAACCRCRRATPERRSVSLRDAVDRRFPDSKSLADLRNRCVSLGVQPRNLPLLLLAQLAACPCGAFTLPAARRRAVPGLRCLTRR